MTSRLVPIWIIDELEVVHTHRCRAIEGEPVDYYCAPRTAHDLIEHLARPDSHENHRGPSPLVHCDECVGTMAEIESAR